MPGACLEDFLKFPLKTMQMLLQNSMNNKLLEDKNSTCFFSNAKDQSNV